MVELINRIFEWLGHLPWNNFLEHAKSFALPLAGIYVAYKFGRIQADIGRRQAETATQSMATARTKLRLDLFEKRLAIYEALMDVVNKTQRRATITHEDVYALQQGAKSASWLFDVQTADYIQGVSSAAFSLANVYEEIEHEPEVEGRRLLRARKNQLLESFDLHDKKLRQMMEPYLRFTDRAQ